MEASSLCLRYAWLDGLLLATVRATIARLTLSTAFMILAGNIQTSDLIEFGSNGCEPQLRPDHNSLSHNLHLLRVTRHIGQRG